METKVDVRWRRFGLQVELLRGKMGTRKNPVKIFISLKSQKRRSHLSVITPPRF